MGNPTLILLFSSSFSNAASMSLVSLAYMSSCSEISGTDITERLVMETGKEKKTNSRWKLEPTKLAPQTGGLILRKKQGTSHAQLITLNPCVHRAHTNTFYDYHNRPSNCQQMKSSSPSGGRKSAAHISAGAQVGCITRLLQGWKEVIKAMKAAYANECPMSYVDTACLGGFPARCTLISTRAYQHVGRSEYFFG